MFGEEAILKSTNRAIDEKGRIILPSNCHAEPTDKLVIVAKKYFIEVWNAKIYLLYLESCKQNEFTYPDQLTAFIVEDQASVDKTRRLNLGISLKEKYQLDRDVVIEGKKKYIRIWNKEKFNQYKEYLESQDPEPNAPKKRVRVPISKKRRILVKERYSLKFFFYILGNFYLVLKSQKVITIN